MKVVVTGASGQVGAALVQSAPAGCTVVSATRSVCDLIDPAAVERFIARERPDWVLNAAAYTAVDRAEAEQELAFAINAAAPGALARAATACEGRLLHVSTDFVFAGERMEPYRPDSLTGPLNVYGASKLAGERAVIDETAGRALLVRTSWVYSSAGVNFPLRILELLRTRPELGIVHDQIGAPTWARSLAVCIWDLVTGPQRHGVHHWCDGGIASWYDFAVAVQEEALERGLLDRPASIQPIRTDEYPTAARRPRYSLLDTRATSELIGRRPEHWRVNLRRMFDELTGGRTGSAAVGGC